MIKDRLQETLLIIGVIIQIIGFVTFFRDVTNNPIYFTVILIIGYLLILYYCLYKLLKTEFIQSSLIVDSLNNKYQMKNYAFNKKQRKAAFIIFLVATIVTVLLAFTVMRETRNPIAESPMVQIKQIQNRTAIFDFVKINRVNWVGGGAYAVAGRDGYPLAFIMDTTRMERMSRFYGTACAIKFEIETRSDIDRVTIDDAKVFVSRYKTLPKYKPNLPLPFQDENILYIEIDNPSLSKTNYFSASKRVNKGKVENIGVMFLEKGKPETFVLRINAKRPGIYSIQCQLTVRYKREVQTIILSDSDDWLFDK